MCEFAPTCAPRVAERAVLARRALALLRWCDVCARAIVALALATRLLTLAPRVLGRVARLL
jgi:hypothetical protein